MVLVKNTATLITDTASSNEGFRTAIFHDAATTRATYANFSHPYDDDASITVVSALFNATMDILLTSSQTRFEVKDLPILASIGRFRITLISRNLDGMITIKDALSSPLDTYLGLGN